MMSQEAGLGDSTLCSPCTCSPCCLSGKKLVLFEQQASYLQHFFPVQIFKSRHSLMTQYSGSFVTIFHYYYFPVLSAPVNYGNFQWAYIIDGSTTAGPPLVVH